MALALDERGTGDPLVLTHGLGTNRWIWTEAAGRLAHARRVLAVDLPGFGESPSLDSRFDLDVVADAVADQAAARAGERFDLLGHSLGGAVALAMARRRPGRIRRLILHAPAGFRPRSARLAEAVAAAAPLALAVRRRAGRPVAGIGLARRALLWGAIHDPSRLTTEQAQSMLEASRRATQLREAAKAAIAADLAEDLEKLDAPVGFIWGDHDPLMPRSTREVLRRLRPEAPIRVIPEAAHVAQLELPAAFAEAVEFLLDRLTSGPAVSAR